MAVEYSWVDFFKELSNKLLEYRGKGNELLDKVEEIYSIAKKQNNKINNNLTRSQLDKFSIDYNQVDPFTVFGIINRGLQESNRIILCQAFKEVFDLQATIPTDFNSIPIFDARAAWVIANDYDVWDLYEAAIEYADYGTGESKFIDAFNKISNRKTSMGYITFGLFWIRPYNYIAFDAKNYHYVKRLFPDLINYVNKSKITGKDFLEFCEKMQQKYNGIDTINNNMDFSFAAWINSEPVMFQCNPAKYDIVTAISNLNKMAFTVNERFINNIHIGQRVYLWVSGPDGGIIAKAKTISAVGTHEDPEGDKYWKNREDISRYNVWIEITDKRVDNIISKDVIKRHPILSKLTILSMARQSNYTLTIEQAQAIDDIFDGKPIPQAEEMKEELPESPTNKVWIYSPGENAFLWDECIKNGVMYLGWGELGDLSLYSSKEEMRQKLVDIHGSDSSYTNSALATWEFANEMKPGDIVYAKKGQKKVIGRGIVEGDYQFEDSRNDEYKNIRKVNWINNETHDHLDWPAVTKTLTDITKYANYSNQLAALFDNKKENIIDVEYAPYTKDNFIKQVFMSGEEYDKLVGLIENRKNVILQGTPGVGKTFIAKRLAYAMVGEQDDSRILSVQFHQSYSYEDFIEGLRPTSDGKLEIEPGLFKSFCENILEEGNWDKKYFCIIDEINRGNLSKIFGELMMLIEEDKRDDSNNWVTLPYSKKQFRIPRNLYIIGTMNTADRSLSIVDYALRRRFAFYRVYPAFDRDEFKDYLINKCHYTDENVDYVKQKLTMLNKAIDDCLNKDFEIGHSYFVKDIGDKDFDVFYNDVVDYQIVPALEEYLYDDEEKLNELIALLK